MTTHATEHVTVDTVRTCQVESLQRSAAEHGDSLQWVLCEMVLRSGGQLRDDELVTLLPEEVSRLRSTSQDEATQACCDAINDHRYC